MATTKKDWFSKLLKKYMPKIKSAIKLEMQIGNNIAIEQAKRSGINTKASALNITKKDLDAFNERVLMYVKGVNEDISKKINEAVIDNINQRGSIKDLSQSLKSIFDENSNNYFNTKNRMETIARTESNNINNVSASNKAKKLGATGKWIAMVDDNRTSEISRALNKKYGTPEQAIPLSQNFKVTYKSGKKTKTINQPTAPFHPNERDIIMYTFE